ncbi:hypothetical protein QOM21_21015 [Streptomyces sp. Pv4-95]|uniref:hypothetical protein n=1 Tax=Streptomyces sp. Pv4-95 TaxID=3049543 RepID=UPI0038929C89
MSKVHETSEQSTAPGDGMARMETYERPVTRASLRPQRVSEHSPDGPGRESNDPIWQGL